MSDDPAATEGACATCAFFARHVVFDDEIKQDVTRKTGDCRLDPPRPRMGDKGRSVRGLWPLVLLGDWCGKWRRRGG